MTSFIYILKKTYILNIFHRRLMKIQRRLYEANKATSYFCLNNYDFKNENFMNLCNVLRLEDVKKFDFKETFYYDKILNVSSLI